MARAAKVARRSKVARDRAAKVAARPRQKKARAAKMAGRPNVARAAKGYNYMSGLRGSARTCPTVVYERLGMGNEAKSAI